MVNHKTKIGKLPTPTRKGYVFDGWYTKKSGGTLAQNGLNVDAEAFLHRENALVDGIVDDVGIGTLCVKFICNLLTIEEGDDLAVVTEVLRQIIGVKRGCFGCSGGITYCCRGNCSGLYSPNTSYL